MNEPGAPNESPSAQANARWGLTVLLLALLTLAFAIECFAARSFSPSANMLVALGGSSRDGIAEGEWFRLLTATLLHGDVVHLLCNAVTLAVGGIFVETMVGKRWLLTVYTLSGIAGSIFGLMINSPSIVSVGASGAIMGVLAAGFVLTFRLPSGGTRIAAQINLGRFLLPSLIPIASSHGDKVDFAAHIGGSLGGALVASIVAIAWRSETAKRPLPLLASILSLVSSTLFTISIAMAVPGYTARAESASLDLDLLLVKDNAIPDGVAQATDTVDVWGKGHERDPRVRYYRAIGYYNEQRWSDAEHELRAGLEERAILKKAFDRKLEVTLRAVLVEVLRKEEKFDQARREASPVCDAGPNGAVPPQLAKLGVCGPRH